MSADDPSPPASPFDARRHAHVDTPEANAELAEALRALNDACVRTEAGETAVRDATARVRELAAALSAEQLAGPRNITAVGNQQLDDAGNPAVGQRNPFAPPLTVQILEGGRVESHFNLGAAYEGPPGCVHGGMVSLILDQVMGTVPWTTGKPGMTAYLHVNYRRPTRLGIPLTCEAWLDRRDGFKTFVSGRITTADGEITADAEGLFVTPRFARREGDLPQSDAPEPRG